MLQVESLKRAFKSCFDVYRGFFRGQNASYSLYLKCHRGRVYWAEFEIYTTSEKGVDRRFAVDIDRPRYEDVYLFIGNAVVHFDNVGGWAA